MVFCAMSMFGPYNKNIVIKKIIIIFYLGGKSLIAVMIRLYFYTYKSGFRDENTIRSCFSDYFFFYYPTLSVLFLKKEKQLFPNFFIIHILSPAYFVTVPSVPSPGVSDSCTVSGSIGPFFTPFSKGIGDKKKRL